MKTMDKILYLALGIGLLAFLFLSSFLGGVFYQVWSTFVLVIRFIVFFPLFIVFFPQFALPIMGILILSYYIIRKAQ